MVKVLPFIEQGVIYTNMANASQKFRFPAFQMTGGGNQPGAPMGVGLRYNAGGQSANPWWRHFSTIELDEVRCPSFAGEPASGLIGSSSKPYYPYASGTQVNPPTNPTPSNPWSVVTTNYKAMVATHFACILNPAPSGGQMLVEKPNGVIVPPENASSKGTSIRSIIDGTSKTIVLAESKEQNYSSWYDGCTSWQVAVPAYRLGASNSTNQSWTQTTPLQPYRITVTPMNSTI